VPDLFNAKWLWPERSLCSTLIRSILITEKGHKGTGNLLLELINVNGLCFLKGRFLVDWQCFLNLEDMWLAGQTANC
jgi:hypothetical protein